MGRATYTEIECKSAMNRVTGMPFNWSLNPYRGCVHACHYCYARATHAYYDMNADEDFETKILVKRNIASVLRRELARPSWARDQVAIGTATDAYQPCEGKYRLTRACLEAFVEARNPISIVTKSTLVIRDIDLLAELAKHARVRVYLTITTLDLTLWKSLEPGTPPPSQRLAALRRLNDAGVPAGVLMAPVMPGITDSEASIFEMAAAVREHGGISFAAIPLRLAPLVKEHYLRWVDEWDALLTPRYLRAYPGRSVNAPMPLQDVIVARVEAAKTRFGFMSESRYATPAAHPPVAQQLDLGL